MTNFRVPGQMIKVKVQNRLGSRPISGLLDTGCNDDVLSLQACRMLGIDHLIKPESPYARSPTVVDGSPVKVVGSVPVDILVGKTPYQATFTVLEKMPNNDILIGTKFLSSKGIFNKIYDLVGQHIGHHNIRKGN